MGLNIIFYLPRPLEEGNELLKAVIPYAVGGHLEVLSDLSGFAARLNRPKDPSSVAIVWDPTSEELRRIAAMKNLLAGVRTLLVLPDQETETLSLAHKIMPAYISYTDQGTAEIISVLERLCGT
jgi:hypothetical protein